MDVTALRRFLHEKSYHSCKMYAFVLHENAKLLISGFFKGVLGTRFGSLEFQIGSLESEKIINGSLDSEKIGSLESEKSGP